MKIQVTVTEEAIRSAIESKVKLAINEATNGYSADNYIKEQVKLHFKSSVDTLIQDVLKNSPKLREKVTAEVEKKIRSQLAAVIKKSGA